MVRGFETLKKEITAKCTGKNKIRLVAMWYKSGNGLIRNGETGTHLSSMADGWSMVDLPDDFFYYNVLSDRENIVT